MTLTAYTKPDCPYCARAKAALDEAGLDYEQRDVESDARTADESVCFSGVATVPQVFLGVLHVNGSTDVTALHERGLLAPLASAVHGRLDPDAIDADTLAQGAEDLVLRDVIPESDGTHDPDPETWPILHLYPCRRQRGSGSLVSLSRARLPPTRGHLR